MKTAKINNIKDLRDDLVNVYEQLRGGEIGLREANIQANVAGKIISTLKVEDAYDARTKKDSVIEFLEK